MTVTVELAHYECCISSNDIKELLQDYHKKVAKKIVSERLINKFKEQKISGGKSKFHLPDTYIQLANHAFSEQVFLNPLSDFRAVEQWRKGVYKFPFYGKHRPLGILRNEKKSASKQIMGTAGEIISAIFYEAYFNQRVLVRPIDKYPDFIGWNNKTGFSYCECKSADRRQKNFGGNKKILKGNVQTQVLKDLMTEKVKEFATNEELTIYLTFSTIERFSPTNITHTVVEIFTKKRNSRPSLFPASLAAELTDDAISRVLEILYKERIDVSVYKNRKKEIKKNLEEDVREEIKKIEKSAGLDVFNPLSNSVNLDEEIKGAIERNKSKIDDLFEGKKPDDPVPVGFSKKINKEKMEKEREFDNQNDMYIQHLNRKSTSYLDMNTRSMPIYKKNNHEFYPFGNALIGIVGKNTEAKTIDVKDTKWESL